MGGPLKAIEVNQCNTCGVAAAYIQPPRLFQFLDPKIRPIATPSRRCDLVDMQFIRKELEKLLAQGVIEPSRNPWSAQVLVTKDERHKRRMVIRQLPNYQPFHCARRLSFGLESTNKLMN